LALSWPYLSFFWTGNVTQDQEKQDDICEVLWSCDWKKYWRLQIFELGQRWLISEDLSEIYIQKKNTYETKLKKPKLESRK
jgi:hypothetical protein